jgi:hypothetical protein
MITEIYSRQGAKNAKSGSLISLPPLREIFLEFWLRLCRAAFFVVNSREALPTFFHGPLMFA